jgi:hypothetical protein
VPWSSFTVVASVLSSRTLSVQGCGEDGETDQNREAVAREKSGGCYEMAVWYGGGGGGRQQAATSNDCWLRDVSRKKKRRGKNKKRRSRPAGPKMGHMWNWTRPH